MHTQILTANTQDRCHDVDRSDEAAIWGEIAQRLLEAKDATSGHRAVAMISRLHSLALIHPEALWLVVSLLTGDLSEVTKSYAEMGRDHAKSKQAVEQERSRALAAIQLHFPKLAQAVIELRHVTSQQGPMQVTKEF